LQLQNPLICKFYLSNPFMNPTDRDSLCPCESGKPYSDCCGPLIGGIRPAETAVELMRSRYTAYTQSNWNYLVQTTHPQTKTPQLRKELETNEGNPRWSGLTILSTQAGKTSDKVGKVKFVASYFLKGNAYSFEENSRFKRHNGVWKYLDAEG